MKIGDIIDHHYRITELIGTGGMAHVYLAVSIATRRKVAIKVLKEEYSADAEFLRRFEREAKAILHFAHPNIVRAYGIGQHEGLPYIIMEYVEGQTLKDILQANGPLSEKRAADITSQVLLALAAAHKEGIVHRDVKPQNVIITPDGNAKLADFGIARDIGSDTKTFSGDKVIGSVNYISPEQATGKDVTFSADLYSAGVMLYELVTGTVPFAGDSSVSVALMHVNSVPEEPIRRNPDISPAVNAVILKALEKKPEDRYPSAGEMRRILLLALQNPTETQLALLHEQSREDTPASPTAIVSASASTDSTHKTGSLRHWAVRIAALITICLCAFTGMFFGMRAVLGTSAKDRPLAPNLLGKTLAEAREKAESYGFDLVVGEYEVNADVPAGCVTEQFPSVGVATRRGSDITVNISLGPEVATVPNLCGLTPSEAANVLESLNLTVGHISYRATETSVGLVCDQSPSVGTEMVSGEAVDICVSSTSIVSGLMPEVSGITLAEALQQLESAPQVKVFVVSDALSTSGVGLITGQVPVAGESVQAGSTVELTVAQNDTQWSYYCDVAFNIDIEQPGTKLMATVPESVNGVDLERVVFEGEYEKGTLIPVSFTAYATAEGPTELVLYLNGTEYKRTEITFLSRGIA